MTRDAAGSERWTLLVDDSVARFLKKLDDRKTALRIASKLEELQYDPFPPGHKKLRGGTCEYRIRIGDFRVLYTVETKDRIVTIYDVDRRDRVYR